MERYSAKVEESVSNTIIILDKCKEKYIGKEYFKYFFTLIGYTLMITTEKSNLCATEGSSVGTSVHCRSAVK